MNNITTPEVRLSFPKLFNPEINALKTLKAGEVPEKHYSTEILIPKTETKFIEDLNKKISEFIAANQAAGKLPKNVNNIRTPLKDGDEKAKNDPKYNNYSGYWVISAKSREAFKPQVFEVVKRPDGSVSMPKLEQESAIYGGVYARVIFNLRTYNMAGNAGIRAELVAVLKIRDGESFGTTARLDASGVANAFGLEISDNDSNIFDYL